MVIVSAVLESGDMQTPNYKDKGSFSCTEVACGTTYLLKMVFFSSDNDTIFRTDTLDDARIKANGSFIFWKQSCPECIGTTYYELRNAQDSLLAKQKFYYEGTQHHSEHFKTSWLFYKEKIKIYEFDTLLNERVYLEDLN